MIIFLLAKGASQLSSGTDHADYSHRNENLKRRYPARSVTSYIVWTDEMVIPQTLGKNLFHCQNGWSSHEPASQL